MVDWDTVRELALTFPEVEESGEEPVAFQVGGKLWPGLRPERAAGGLAIRVDPDEKPLILDTNPDGYFPSPHYEGLAGSADPARGRSIARSCGSGSKTPGSSRRPSDSQPRTSPRDD